MQILPLGELTKGFGGSVENGDKCYFILFSPLVKVCSQDEFCTERWVSGNITVLKKRMSFVTLKYLHPIASATQHPVVN